MIFFKLILLENDTANHFAFTTQFPKRTSSLRGSRSLWCIFLTQILMPVGRSDPLLPVKRKRAIFGGHTVDYAHNFKK